MLGGKPVFPGTSTVNQLEKVLELTGQPSPEDIRSAGSQYAERMLESIGPVTKRELALGGSEPTGPPLLHACLKFNPSLRCTAVQALEDPFVAEFHKSEEEPDFPNGPVKIAVDDNTKLTAADYRNNLYKQIQQIKQISRSAAPDQQISRSVDQQISRSADQISRSADQQISRSADQQSSSSAAQQISKSANQQISRSADQQTADQ